MNGEGSVYQRGDGRWIGAVTVGYDAQGRQQRKTVSGVTADDALKKLRAVQKQLAAGLPPPDDRMTISQLLERWLAGPLRYQVTPAAYANYEIVARHHLIPALGRKRVAKLTPVEVDGLLTAKLDKGLAPSTVRRIRGVLSMAIDQAQRWDVVHRNVARMARAPKLIRKEGRTLSPNQAQRLLQSLEGDRFEALYLLTLTLGLRRGEVLGLMWADIDLKRGTLNVQRSLKRQDGRLVLGDLKTPKSRRSLNLPEQAVKALKTHKARQAEERLKAGETWRDNGLVFTTQIGTPFDGRNLYRDFVRVSEHSGIGRWHPHELRHSATSLMITAGVPIETVSKVLGHSSIRVTADVYTHLGEPQLRQAAEAIAGVLWGPPGEDA